MILSIDVGIRNLAMCLMASDGTGLVHNWDVSGIPPKHEDGIFLSLKKHLDERPWVLSATTVLIEKQPDKNKTMKSVENFLHAYCIIMNSKAETIIYDARHKIPDVAGAGKALYRKRKQTSIDRCRALLEEPGNVNAHWLPVFLASKKKDDLADTVMQALSYTNRRPDACAKAKKVAKKLVSRKPNEHQKDTKYSQSNLAWFVKNHARADLEKNKRFLKDLGRYYKNIDELILNIG
jgi:hypothetical protein